VYSGYTNTVDETIDGMSMYIGSTNAQVGVNMTDVTAQYVHVSENKVIQADDGDNTMPCNAFLVVQYKGEEEEEKKEICGRKNRKFEKIKIESFIYPYKTT